MDYAEVIINKKKNAQQSDPGSRTRPQLKKKHVIGGTIKGTSGFS